MKLAKRKEERKERKSPPRVPKRQSTLGSNNVATSHQTKTWTLRPHGYSGLSQRNNTLVRQPTKRRKEKKGMSKCCQKSEVQSHHGPFAGFLDPSPASTSLFVFVRTPAPPRLSPRRGIVMPFLVSGYAQTLRTRRSTPSAECQRCFCGRADAV